MAIMNRFRHRRLRTRLALLALVAMLWSQVALAAHPLCVMTAMATQAVSASAHGDHECPTSEPSEKAMCDAHCAQGDLNNDSSRIPPVAPMPPAIMPTLWAFVPIRQQHLPLDRPWPHASWNRPTANPASILLI
ncbi:MAG: hypothetical protein ABIQ48_04360 [Luteimonas sp.]